MVYFNYSWPLRTFRSNERFKSYPGRELSSLSLPPFPRDLSYETYLNKTPSITGPSGFKNFLIHWVND